jgi:hypothetical protein
LLRLWLYNDLAAGVVLVSACAWPAVLLSVLLLAEDFRLTRTSFCACRLWG